MGETLTMRKNNKDNRTRWEEQIMNKKNCEWRYVENPSKIQSLAARMNGAKNSLCLQPKGMLSDRRIVSKPQKDLEWE